MSKLGVKLPLAALVAVVTLLGVLANGAGIASATDEIHVGDRNNNSLADVQEECFDAGGTITSWTFIINQIRSGPKPDITVEFASGATAVVSAGRQGGSSNAHYTVVGTGEVVDAYTSIHAGWRGQFVLSHVTCEEGPGTPPADACTPFANRIIITFDDYLLRRDQVGGIQTPSETVSIDPGTYLVTLRV